MLFRSFSPFSLCFQCMRDSHEGRSVSNSSKNHKKREKKKKRERKNSKVAWVSKCAVWICACICKKVVLADFSFFFFLKLLLSFFFLTALADVARVGCNDSVGVCVC